MGEDLRTGISIPLYTTDGLSKSAAVNDDIDCEDVRAAVACNYVAALCGWERGVSKTVGECEANGATPPPPHMLSICLSVLQQWCSHSRP